MYKKVRPNMFDKENKFFKTTNDEDTIKGVVDGAELSDEITNKVTGGSGNEDIPPCERDR